MMTTYDKDVPSQHWFMTYPRWSCRTAHPPGGPEPRRWYVRLMKQHSHLPQLSLKLGGQNDIVPTSESEQVCGCVRKYLRKKAFRGKDSVQVPKSEKLDRWA